VVKRISRLASDQAFRVRVLTGAQDQLKIKKEKMRKIIILGIVVLVILISSFLVLEKFSYDSTVCNYSIEGAGSRYCRAICNFSGGKIVEETIQGSPNCGGEWLSADCSGIKSKPICQWGLFNE
jgi:hypothetical protein